MASLKASSSSLFFLSFLLLCINSEAATNFLVGGNTNAWSVPTTTEDSLNQWAAANRFLVGDCLVWKYDATKDSVLRVTREAYTSCDRTSPLAEYKDGNTVVKLESSGPHYFISGAEGACEEGEKLIVVVLSEKHSLRGLFAPVPAPAPTEFGGGPAVAPTSCASQMATVLKGGAFQGAILLALGMLPLL